MAVRNLALNGSRGAIALALALIALPAEARPGENESQGWRSRGEQSAPRAEGNRSSNENANRGGGDSANRGGSDSNRGGGGWQRPAPEQSSQRAQSASQPGGWQGRGNWAGNAAQTQAAPAPAPAARPQWGGGDRRGGIDGQNRASWGDRNRTPQAGQAPAPAPAAQPRWSASSGRDGDRTRSGDWNRDGDRTRSGEWNRDGDRWRGQQSRGRETWTNNNRSGSWDRDRDHHRYQGDYRRWNNDWRRDNRYNWSYYRGRHHDVFRLQPYYSPYRNYSYRRLSIGFFLDSLFFSSNYWINDPWQYRLPEAYGPYRWVRYYDDALLVDIYSGEVVDVIHDFFW